MTECQVRLHRDALNTPWGFRLQGGKDFNCPLTIQRVFAGSPADGEVHRGDIILAIDNYDVSQMSHKNAQDLIKKGGGSISLRIKRSAKVGPDFYSAPQSPSTGFHSQPFVNPASVPASHPNPRPTQMSGGFQGYGVDYSRPHAPQHGPAQPHYGGAPPPPDHSMLSRVNQTLSEVVWQPSQPQYQPQQPQYQPQQPQYQPQSFNQQPQQGDDDLYEPKSIHQLKQQFSSPNASHARQDDLDEHEEPHRSVKDLTHTYQAPGPAWRPPQRKVHSVHSAQSYHTVPRKSSQRAPGRWQKPPADSIGVSTGLSEPGWTPKSMTNQSRRAPAAPTYNPTSFSQDHPDHHPSRPVNHPPSRPAWAGTLKGSNVPKPWELQEGEAIVSGPPEQAPVYQRQNSGGGANYNANHADSAPVVPHQPKVQNVHYGPGDAPVYEQHNPATHDSDTAQVHHSQYNTPIGLYSQQNVQHALDSQTVGKPGQGTLQVSGTGPDGKKPFNPEQSDVYRLLMEEEAVKLPRGHGLPPQQQQQQQQQQQHQHQDQSARYAPQQQGQEMQYQGYQDHTVQSKSMQNLEYNMNHQQNEEYGTSDF